MKKVAEIATQSANHEEEEKGKSCDRTDVIVRLEKSEGGEREAD